MSKEFKSLNGYPVKDEIAREKINKLSIYDQNEITTEKFRDETSETDYYITKIGAKDKLGNSNIFRVGIANDDATISTVEEPSNFAKRKKSPVVMNAGIFYSNYENPRAYGYVIKEGIILKNEELKLSDEYPYMLAIKDDGTMKEFPTDGSISAQDIVNLGYSDCIIGFYPLFKDGRVVDYSGFPTAGNNPRNVICRNNDGSYLILTCDGRSSKNKGMNLDDVVRILGYYKPDFAFEFDGGGSTGTIVKGLKINENIDDYGRKERKVATMLYLDKEESEIYHIFGDIHNKEKIDKINEKVKELQSPFISDYFTGNLFDKDSKELTINKYVDTSGNIITYGSSGESSDIFLTGFIRVPADSNIVVSGFSTWPQLSMYDENKEFIAHKGGIVSGEPFKTRPNTCYVRCIVTRNDLKTYMLEVGNSSSSSYIPHKNFKYELLYENDGGETNPTIGKITSYKKLKIYYKQASSGQVNCKEILLGENTNTYTNVLSLNCANDTTIYGFSARLTINKYTGEFIFDRMYEVTLNSSLSLVSKTDSFVINRIEGFYE